MTRDEWRSVKAIVSEALGLPEPARARLVAERCGSDERLHREVESLLTSAVAAGELFEEPILRTAGLLAFVVESEEAAGSLIGRRIGAYRILSEIGRGGMGAAFLGERADEAFTRRVAIKLIKRGMDTDVVLRRFLHERQILANLNHPNIATLLDGGATDDDRPYFVMEFVDGVPIDEYCDRCRLSVRDRLQLFLAVCGAVAHAHDNRVVHRDLKPANILVTQAGVPKLLDFGIAKLLHADRAAHTEVETAMGAAMTLEYASPEQLRGLPVTPATDVYSLGVLLYELLTGLNPQSAAGRTAHETEHAICERMPPYPSAVVTQAGAECRGITRRALRRRLAGDLDAIVITALQKAPERRYGSVRALADDIQRHLEEIPILARREPLAARMAERLLRKNGRAAAVGVPLVIGLALASFNLPHTPSPVASPPVRSVAVLPLGTAGPHRADLEFLAQGITENVIRRLSRFPELSVVGRDSAYRFADRTIDSRDAGRELGVQTVLTGTLTGREGTLTLDVELLDVRDGTRLWGEQFARGMIDVQFLPAELAAAISNRLQVRASAREQARAARHHSADPAAYELYLRGRYFWNKRTPQDLEKSVEYFRQATAKDASFALAYAGLADSFALLSEYHAVTPKETYAAAKAAATRALAIDPELAEGHTSLGYIRHFYEWDWTGAETAYKRALELEPKYATAHQWYAELLASMGRHEEAMVAIRRAVEVDPLSLIANSVRAHVFYLAREYHRAVEMCGRVIEMDRHFPEVYEYLKRAYDQLGRYDRSVEARQTRRRLLGLSAELTPALRAAATAPTHNAYWKYRLEQELVEGNEEGLQPFEMAEILAQAGETAQALQWLERACRENDFMMLTVRVAPNLDPLRSHPRFQTLLARTCRVTG